MGNIDRYPTYKGGKVTEVVVYANYIGLRRFYKYVVNISRWSPYEGGQLDRFHCTYKTSVKNSNMNKLQGRLRNRLEDNIKINNIG